MILVNRLKEQKFKDFLAEIKKMNKDKESLKNYPSKKDMIKLAKREIKEWQKFLRHLTNLN